MGQPNPRYG